MMPALAFRAPARRTALALAAALAAAPAGAQERFTLAGPEVAVYNPVGQVEVLPAASGPVVVEAVRTGRDGARLRPGTATIGGVPAFRVQVPADTLAFRDADGESVLLLRDDGSFGPGAAGGRPLRITSRGGGLQAGVNLRVRVPPGVRLYLAAGAGTVRIRQVAAEVRVNAVAAAVTAEGTGAALTVHSGGGEVRVSGRTGALEVRTVVGGVYVSGLRATGVVSLHTGGGNIHVTSAAAPELRIQSTVGRVELAGLDSPSITATSGGGPVRVSGPLAFRSLVLRSTTEDVEMVVPPGLDADFHLRTTMGRIHVTAPMRGVQRAARAFTGATGSGGARVEASSASGDVRVLAPPHTVRVPRPPAAPEAQP